jgi:hypothetical protein
MKARIWRYLMFLTAIVLACAAFQRSALAFAEPCPPFPFVGQEEIQSGCCLDLATKTSTLQYYSYYCVGGLAQDSTRICSDTPCTL